MDNNEGLNIGRNWPDQTIIDHAPYWRAWRKQAPACAPCVAGDYAIIGRVWCHFANGKNVGPQLMMDWMQFVVTIQSYKPKNEKGTISARRANKYRQAVKTYLRWLRLMGAILMDPSECMQMVRIDPPAPKQIFTHEEYLKMVEFGMEHASYDTHLWLLILGYHTGMSITDCKNLTWDEVELPEDGPCFIKKIRTKLRSRYGSLATCVIPIVAGSELWVAFKKLQRRANAEREIGEKVVFVHDEASDIPECEGHHVSVQMTDFIRRALGEENRRGRTFKNLRNTFASRLINSGTDCALVSKMTGHARVDQLADYLVPDQAAMQEAIVKGLRYVEKDPALPAEKSKGEAIVAGKRL